MVNRYVPDRSHLVWINFNPSIGREQQGRRPAIVLSPKSYNQRSELAILVPITSKAKGYPVEYPLPEGLPISGVALCDQVKSMDWRNREVELIQEVPITTMNQIRAKIAALIFPIDPR
jgi:mRNA interferase MazF